MHDLSAFTGLDGEALDGVRFANVLYLTGTPEVVLAAAAEHPEAEAIPITLYPSPPARELPEGLQSRCTATPAVTPSAHAQVTVCAPRVGIPIFKSRKA
jgi:hypothetical protein